MSPQKSTSKRISLFEHQTLKLDKNSQDSRFDANHLSALESYFERGNDQYYSLVKDGVKFKHYVGVLQVGNLIIEVLPKADKQSPDTRRYDRDTPCEVYESWRNRLLGMLKAVGSFYVYAPSSSLLALQSNSLLELYFELFIKEIEYLVHSGLIKRYRKIEGNTYSLKGSLLFPKHIQQNLVHQERFYTRYTSYDKEHIWHLILYKAIKLIRTLSSRSNLHNRIGALELCFPEMPDLAITEDTFNRLRYSRRTELYRQAIEIARLIILRYHPDLRQGKNHVLALMFNMNTLWESFVCISLKKGLNAEGYQIQSQKSEQFWKRAGNYYPCRIKPDIVIQKGKDTWILDTKWKDIADNKPAPADLYQLFAYSEYFDAKKVALVFPGVKGDHLKGHFKYLNNTKAVKECDVFQIEPLNSITQWQSEICSLIKGWIEP